MASTGVKALIPIGRPFLDYVLSALADAGVHRICLVIGPEHDLLRRRYSVETTPTRLTIEFAVQQEPRGTADAVLAAESWTGGEPFLVINSDNYYPRRRADGRWRARRARPGRVQPGRPARRWTNRRLHASPVSPCSISTATTCDGSSRSPTRARSHALGDDVFLSMNCWRFDRRIFPMCREVPLSAARRARAACGRPARALQTRRDALPRDTGGIARSWISRDRWTSASVAARLAGVEVVL